MSSWSDPHNAELYDRFARDHGLYRNTSRDLVELAEIDAAAFVVDLACGTGVTTEAILERVSATARVIALDGSQAMLDIARRTVLDDRVDWVRAPAVELERHATDADAIVCNSAIWQLDMEAAIVAAAQVLRSGGRLVFNIGRGFLMLPLSEAELRPTKPSFHELIQAVAILDYGYAPPHPAAGKGGTRRLLTPDSVREMIERAGLIPDEPRTFEYDDSPESLLAWVNVPVFADNVLPGMPHEQQLEVHAKAYERWDKSQTETSAWFAFVARK